MPDKQTMERAREDAREGKSPSTQAGEFVKEEIDDIREGKHGPFAATGNRDRIVKGAPCRRDVAASEEGFDLRGDAHQSRTR
ncbi:MAG: hypothetical protein ABSG11_01105 [Candidatus Korobacteraceae bacterium]|jgi:hypothetical protein